MPDALARARSLLGVPFRPQGRNPKLGLDCIGLVLAAFDLEWNEPARYRLGDGDWSMVERHLQRLGFDETSAPEPANVVAARGETGFHFGVLGPQSFVHADLSIGKVVETPGHPGCLECRYFKTSSKA